MDIQAQARSKLKRYDVYVRRFVPTYCPMHELTTVTAPQLFVHQKKEMAEVFADFETENRYEIATAEGAVVLTATESSGGWAGLIGRNVLSSLRSFEMLVRDAQNQVVLQLRRPFKLFFSRLEVQDGQGRKLGTIQRRWGILQRRFSIEDVHGQEIARIGGPLWKPWTFYIRQRGAEVGKISKRWSGLLQESFTDADTFGVEFGPTLDERTRVLAFAATFLIDFIFFERSS